MLHVLYDRQHIVSAAIILNELFDNVFVFDLDVDGLIQHLLKVPNLILLDPDHCLCLCLSLPSFLDLCLLFEQIIAVLLPLPLHL